MPPKMEKNSSARLEALVTRFKVVETFCATIDADNPPEKACIEPRITILKNLYKEYELDLGRVLSKEISEDADIEGHIQKIETMYVESLSTLTGLCPNDREISESQESKIQTIKLPDVNIPIFDGKSAEWLAFKETFIAIIDKNKKLSDIIKFTYLLDKLKGEAKQTIGHISLSEAGYKKAFNALMDRYDNKRQLVEIHIDGILNLPTVLKDNCAGLRTILNLCNSHIASLESLGQIIGDMSQMFVVSCVVRKLDINLRKEWETELKPNELPTLSQLQNFLSKRCRILESIECSRKPIVRNNVPDKKIPSSKVNHSNTFMSNTSDANKSIATETSTNTCRVCKMSFHPFYLCAEFKKMSVEQRFQKIKELKLCFNCFSSKHTSKDCTRGTCKHCPNKHNSLLHREIPKINQINHENNATALASKGFSKRKTLFPTAIILIQDKSGNWHPCRALLDSASDANFISEELCQKFSFDTKKGSKSTLTTLNDTRTMLSNMVNLNIKSAHTTFKKNITCTLVTTIVNRLPSVDLDISRWSFPPKVMLADPKFGTSQQIDILLGNELFFEIIKPKQIHLPNIPLLQDSVFGYLVVGPYERNNSMSFCNKVEVNDPNINLTNAIFKFWELESFPDQKFLSEDEKSCEQYFMKTHRRDADGRYIVSMPLTSQVKELGDSKSQALQRFLRLEKRLYSDPIFKEQYFAFIDEYISLNHMKKIEIPINDNPNFYLPHHGVLKPSSSTTKLRVVFDASAKSSSNVSLNDSMLIGPSVQQNLFDIILRFRKHPIVFTADIAKMYRQIKVETNQTKFQRILWRFNSNQPIDTYELQTVTYGTASAPYLATRTLKQLTEDEKVKFPLTSEVASKDFYIDDVLTGVQTLKEGLKLQNEMIELLALGGFKLHKWCSNSEQLLKNIPKSDREILHTDQFSSQESMKTLGLLWKPKQDLFYFNIQPINENQILTKRSILSDIAKIYDPLGLLSPITISAKILIQSTWKIQCDWDDEIPLQLSDSWNQFRTQLPSIKEININRGIIPIDPIRIELHGFCDASERAYGACIFLKCLDETKKIHVNLVCSKTRVAPLKVVSLPRLELCAALLLSRLMVSVVRSLELKVDKIVLWSDSTVTLQWLKISPHKLKTFIANRVNEIQELTQNYEWNHVSSVNNVADIISRGIFPNELKDLKNWWFGPNFLYSDEGFEISNEDNETSEFDQSLLELKPEETLSFVSKLENFDIFNKYSSLDKLCRIIALCFRFFTNLKDSSSKNVDFLSVSEIDNALIKLVKLVQISKFNSEINYFILNKPLPNNSKLKGLNPFLDDYQMLRVGGRLAHSDYEYDVKHQLLLPYDHPFTELVFWNEHRKNFHCGPQLLLSIVRQRFWPIKGKFLAKKIVRKCVTCFKMKPKCSQQIMGQLPAERTAPSKPFSTTGVDLCGPFYIKNKFHRKSPLFKVYVATFICFVTKAIHLEIVSDLTSESFLACLKRFLYRRGKCVTLWSDNATNFVGCNNDLKNQKLFLGKQNLDEQIINYCAMNQIDWKFIPPNAPNFGGLWESSVKSLKFHLKRVTCNQVLYYEELNTLIIQIEGILNSRPLSIMSSDPSDPEPLTPAHFLTGGKILAPPERLYDNIPSNRLKAWKRIEQLTQSFWKRFSIEYVHTLQERHKWKTSEDNLKSGDIVLISTESSQPTHWLMGKILHAIPGKDGKCRVFDIRTQRGNFRRPISKVCKLPIDN